MTQFENQYIERRLQKLREMNHRHCRYDRRDGCVRTSLITPRYLWSASKKGVRS